MDREILRCTRYGSKKSSSDFALLHEMKTTLQTSLLPMLVVVCLSSAISWAQNDSAGLDRVLTQMDTAAKNLRSTEANFVWDHYDSVIKEIDDHQTGKIYFRRDGGTIQMAVDI